ncbi:MAG: 16S rRNA (guanine(527)-N(7))-methyltransferase RsmG [Clostridia bacterium]|nr:16S rRNA (guanine(527)-N(7))-methyltransferase RsmG [Clostridia bacterium]
MLKEEFSQKMKELSKEINLVLKEEQIQKFYQYMQLLLEWNEKMNLTAITQPEDIIQKHFIDSLTIAQYIKPGAKLIDVGTGAGFPGIPLKIVREDLEITLIDSLNKRIRFLQEVREELKLLKIEAIHARIEELGNNKKVRETFDYATSRAVANLATLSEYLLPLVKINGTAIAMKGNEIEEELRKSKKAIHVLGGEVEKVDSFLLPQSNMNRNVVFIRKIAVTPSKYPRKPGQPSKEPIQ